MKPPFSAPPRWTSADLDRDRLRAQETFRVRRRQGAPVEYQESFESVEPLVLGVLSDTEDLASFDAESLTNDNELWLVLRYFCGPQVSEEDFWTLVGRKFKKMPSEVAEEAARVFHDMFDYRRLPWLAEHRSPRPGEREAAVLATATLLAHERLRTSRRGQLARKQEGAVARTLQEAGYQEIAPGERAPIDLLDDLPRGSYSREQKIAGAKCDVPVRLKDGRLMAIECKVSNGPKNGWKRLLREVGGKSTTWRQTFGSQLITSAVIAGVFDLRCLERAQEEHDVSLFWDHSLHELARFVSESK